MVSPSSALLLAVNVILAILGQLAMKHGVSTIGRLDLQHIGPFLVRAASSFWIWVGIALYALSTVFWVMVLSKVSLSIAYPTLSLGYVLIVLISAIFLNEPLTSSKALGSVVIVLGVILLSR